MTGSNMPGFTPLGENMLLVFWQPVIDPLINVRVHALANQILSEPFPGYVECVPAYASLAVVFDPLRISIQAVQDRLMQFLAQSTEANSDVPHTVRVPVCYDGADMDVVATSHRLTSDDVISIHSGKAYSVYMMGFLPGFAYLGSVDHRIATPRLQRPRTSVPAGSVGIAGEQTGVYPVQSPGGWQLIGRTPVKFFRPESNDPFLVKPGDRVEFFPITEREFNHWNDR